MDWRIGLAVIPKYRDHMYFNCIGVIRKIENEIVEIEVTYEISDYGRKRSSVVVKENIDNWKSA